MDPAVDTPPSDTAHVPESPGSHSTYDAEFYWDPQGDTNYSSDSFDIDPLYGGSTMRLGRTQEDLQKFRQRIDANADHQREYSDIMSAMHQKVRLS